MARRYDSIELPAVSSVTPAPHRYTWDSEGTDGTWRVEDGRVVPPGRDFIAASPYQKGEAIYIAYGDGFKLAYVSLVTYDYDQYNDRRHKFRVHTANARGDRFSKNFHYVWPGMIQRGYTRAGLAPDCEGKV